jgi:hypothetical protein
MYGFSTAGKRFHFLNPIAELSPFEILNGTAEEAVPFVPASFHLNASTRPDRHLVGWVGRTERLVQVYDTQSGMLLKVEGANEFLITPGGETITKIGTPEDLSPLDREIICGPALVLALALRDVWSLHASSARFKGQTIAFLGESGQGKSTLAAYLAKYNGWQLVADDILPVTAGSSSVQAWPRFPQLKLPLEAQPGVNLPEQLPLDKIVLLCPAGLDETPGVEIQSTGEAVKVLLAHTAGTRLFDPHLLGKHLEFCTRSAALLPVYKLVYPRRWDSLPVIKELLEGLC